VGGAGCVEDLPEAFRQGHGHIGLEHLHDIDLAAPQRRNVLCHRASRHPSEPGRIDALFAQVMLKAHPRGRHFADHGYAQPQQVGQLERST